MVESKLIYNGPPFNTPGISPIIYNEDFFTFYLDIESELFYDLRKKHHIKPYRINQSSTKEQKEIKDFFIENRESFYFLFDNNKDFIGAILFIGNYIQSLAVAKKYQRKGYGTRLTQFAINKILSNGYDSVVLNVLGWNEAALNLYLNLGFTIQK
jgi:ribosomal protein S18 acetylase RimI-like enzyme